MVLSLNRTVRGKVVCTVLAGALLVFTLYNITFRREIYQEKNTSKNVHQEDMSIHKYKEESDVPLWEQTLDFEKLNFSNETGNPQGCYLVPNYIHYVSFGGKPINYLQLICILAAFKNQKPEKIFFHHNDEKTFSGKYWEILENTQGFKEIAIFNKVEIPNKIFGRPFSDGWKNWHASDVVRIQVLMKFGGVYLDADCYLVQKIDRYRKFEMTINWDEGKFLGNQVLIAHKDARFLKKYLDTYKFYDKDKWYYNAGERPTTEILFKEPELIHRVKVLFGADIKFAFKMFQEQWREWKEMYIIHLLSKHQYLFKNLSEKATFPVEFNEDNIAYYDITFREMAYDVYDIANIKWARNRFDIDKNN